MKKFYFLFLFALIASISNLYAAEKTVTSTFKDKDLTVGVGEPGWVASITANSFESNNNNRGVQFGAAKGAFTLKTSESFSQVKKVSVILSTNEKVNTVSLKVGGTSVDGMKTLSKSNNYAVNWSVVSPQDGIIEFSFNDKKGSIYIKSISITYEFAETQCATPTFNLTADATYTDAQTLVITSTTADATIHYTVNGGAEKIGQPAEFTENGKYIVDAWATKDGLTDSEHASITFTIDKKCAAPTFSLVPGSYTTAQTVTITGPEGSTITYTLNGDIFEAPSPVNVELPLVEGVSTTYNLSAFASMKDFKDSEETKAVYVINESYADKTATLNIANYASANGWTSGEQYIAAEIDDVKFTVKGGVNDGKYYSNKKGDSWRVYDSTSGTLTISVPAMHIIASVVYEATYAFASADSGTLSNGTVKGEWKWNAAATNTTEGDPVNSVTFTAGNGNNVELKKITVYYAYDPVSSVSSMSSEGVKVVAAEGGVKVVAEEAAEVAVYTAAGQLVRQARVAEGSTLVNVAPGFYVVRANGTATKVIVR